MKYNRFEELPVWKAAIELAVGVFALTAKTCFRGHSGTRNQLENAAVSVSNNIAEGFERGTTQELLTFLYIARGSSGETRSALCLCERLEGFGDLKFEIQSGRSLSPTPSLGGFAAKFGRARSTVSDQQDPTRIARSPRTRRIS